MLIAVLVLSLLVGFFTMTWWMPHEWYRALFYPGRRPNALSRRLNALSAWAGSLGVAPSFMVTIETQGRQSGKPSRVPLVVAEVRGERYLVSMLGENADWVRNTKAAGGAAVLIHGTTERVQLEEVAIAERAPILKAYLRRAPGGRPHFDVDVDAPLEEFIRVAPRYPVFLIKVYNREEGKP